MLLNKLLAKQSVVGKVSSPKLSTCIDILILSHIYFWKRVEQLILGNNMMP